MRCFICEVARPHKGWKQLGWQIHRITDEDWYEPSMSAPVYRFDICPDCWDNHQPHPKGDALIFMETDRVISSNRAYIMSTLERNYEVKFPRNKTV